MVEWTLFIVSTRIGDCHVCDGMFFFYRTTSRQDNHLSTDGNECDIIMTCCSIAVQDYDLYFRAEQLIHLYKEHNGNRTDQTKKKTKEMQLRKMKKSQIIRMVCNCWRYNGRFWQ